MSKNLKHNLKGMSTNLKQNLKRYAHQFKKKRLKKVCPQPRPKSQLRLQPAWWLVVLQVFTITIDHIFT